MGAGYAEYGDAVFLGELDADGNPAGQGTLTFPDGTSFRGTVFAASVSGRGVWTYPDGSSMRGGFSVGRGNPAVAFEDAAGRRFFRILRAHVSDPDTDGSLSADARELSARADRAALLLRDALRREAPDAALEFNARALLADEIVTENCSGEQIADLVSRAIAARGTGTVIRVPAAVCAILSYKT